MLKFVDHRAQNGTYYFKVDEILNRIKIAARVIVACGDPEDTIVREYYPLLTGWARKSLAFFKNRLFPPDPSASEPSSSTRSTLEL